MTTENRSITPPQWQIDAWCKQALAMGADVDALFLEAARWGADQELQACCEWLDEVGPSAIPLWGFDLRKDRRPTPRSLAEQKQAIHDEIHQLLAQISASNAGALAVAEPIRRALERLRELEQGDG